VFDWLDGILNKTGTRENDFSGAADAGAESVDTTSSSARGNAEREKERAMRERLESFMKEQEKLDADGKFTDDEKAAALEKFGEQELLRSQQETPCTLADLEKRVQELYNQLENMQRLIPWGGEDGQVVSKDGSRVVWANIAALLFALPTGAVSNLYLCLKHKDSPSLDTDDATVFVVDGGGLPLWYIQFDYLRGVPTPTP